VTTQTRRVLENSLRPDAVSSSRCGTASAIGRLGCVPVRPRFRLPARTEQGLSVGEVPLDCHVVGAAAFQIASAQFFRLEYCVNFSAFDVIELDWRQTVSVLCHFRNGSGASMLRLELISHWSVHRFLARINILDEYDVPCNTTATMCRSRECLTCH